MNIAAKAAALTVGVAAAAAEAGHEVAQQMDLNVSLPTILGWGTVLGMFAGAIFAVESRIKTHLADHTEEENAQRRTDHKELKEAIRVARAEQKAELRHLREMLAFAGVIPEHTPAAIRLPDESGDIPPDVDPNPTPGG